MGPETMGGEKSLTTGDTENTGGQSQNPEISPQGTQRYTGENTWKERTEYSATLAPWLSPAGVERRAGVV